MNFTITKANVTTEEFLSHLAECFPEIKEEVLDPEYEGLIHLQIAALARYANDCTDTKKFDELKRIINFFEVMVERVDPVTENALYVSFLEHLEFSQFNEIDIKNYLSPNYFKTWKGLRGR